MDLEPTPVSDPDDGYLPERDYWQEHKDGVAMGYIYPDGTPREPDEPDFWDEDEELTT